MNRCRIALAGALAAAVLAGGPRILPSFGPTEVGAVQSYSETRLIEDGWDLRPAMLLELHR